MVAKEKIHAGTAYDVCNERLSGFGGLLSLVKVFDLIDFDRQFDIIFRAPARSVQLGFCRMVKAVVVLVFIGFQRLGHFDYIREEPMVCGLLGVPRLPAVSTFWRFLRSLSIIQSQSLLKLNAFLRQRVWDVLNVKHRRLQLNFDTTTLTVFGNTEGARIGYNTRHRGHKGLRPLFCFCEETGEYIYGKMRSGQTLSGRQFAQALSELRRFLPRQVEHVLIRGDGEFMSKDAVAECMRQGYGFIFGNKLCQPPFMKDGWYSKGGVEYNDVHYQPKDWSTSCRFVAMRIPKEKLGERQLHVFEEDNYAYRIFATNQIKEPAHEVIACYDKRAIAENQIKEAQQEGICAIPSKNFHTNHAFFQIVMFCYNLWCWIRLMAADAKTETPQSKIHGYNGPLAGNTIRLARLKLLLIAGKLTRHAKKTVIKYSDRDGRTPMLLSLLQFLDYKRNEVACKKNIASLPSGCEIQRAVCNAL